jgi:hypothetical protein
MNMAFTWRQTNSFQHRFALMRWRDSLYPGLRRGKLHALTQAPQNKKSRANARLFLLAAP